MKVRGNRPLVSGFGNVGAMFHEQNGEELHPQIIKMARKSGQLNLSNKGFSESKLGLYMVFFQR